jgi:hypothetical protein
MNCDEAQVRMQEMQRIMERTTLYTLLPGAPAIIGGAAALVGCIASYLIMRSVDFERVLDLSAGARIGFCAMWVVIGVFGVAQEILLTARAARMEGVSPVARPARFAAFSLSPSVVVAAVMTLKLALDSHVQYVVPVWMMCYGTGVYAAGLFSLRLPRMLGLAFIVMGAVGLLLFPQYGVLLAAVSFGAMHIAFGLLVLARQSNEK